MDEKWDLCPYTFPKLWSLLIGSEFCSVNNDRKISHSSSKGPSLHFKQRIIWCRFHAYGCFLQLFEFFIQIRIYICILSYMLFISTCVFFPVLSPAVGWLKAYFSGSSDGRLFIQSLTGVHSIVYCTHACKLHRKGSPRRKHNYRAASDTDTSFLLSWDNVIFFSSAKCLSKHCVLCMRDIEIVLT